MTLLRVRRTGPLTLVEDLGRPGHAAIGVARSGAADRGALRLANRAVGNPEGAAALEVLLGGLELEVVGGSVTLCVTGAPAPVRVGGRDTGPSYVTTARAGDVVRLGTPAVGLRSYVAVRGGIDVPAVLGSRSRDVLAGVGPEPLAEGDELIVGAWTGEPPVADLLPPPRLPDVVELRVVRGPRDAWLVDADRLTSTAWTVSGESNRVGIRLLGEPLHHRDPDRQLPSEGAWRGAVQVPPGGEPVVLLADHPVTGGYPVAGVVVDADVDRAAQARPGQQLRLRWVPAPR
ncbi:biotin-dependent carboxyltransferase family protein [Nocardioides sp. W7]|uniref:5-oxoprolinase subunit C family protein n=1 Tax=Nocardioides sp. W7 TaxID=2931390 RepID=UPI001FD4D48A|nr:biotin-dependent carboxyltransferase family protein [Nocardioides sp. W7]